MTRKRSSRTPSPYQIDRDWPHQVALPDDLCVLHNLTLIMRFCAERAIAHHTRQVQALWLDRKYEKYRIHCFSDRADAEAFQAHFGGEFFDPAKDREGPRAQGVWRRDGRYERVLTSGPLSVPECLRD